MVLPTRRGDWAALNLIEDNTASLDPLFGQYVIGTFTASGTTLNLHTAFTGNPYVGPIINAVQVRDLTPLPPGTTITKVTSSANPSTFGDAVTFTATIVPASGTDVPTGSVQFKVDGSNLGTLVTVTAGTNPNGTATSISTSTLSMGTHTVTAAYTLGSSAFTSSSGTVSGGQIVTAEPAVPTFYQVNVATLDDAHGTAANTTVPDAGWDNIFVVNRVANQTFTIGSLTATLGTPVGYGTPGENFGGGFPNCTTYTTAAANTAGYIRLVGNMTLTDGLAFTEVKVLRGWFENSLAWYTFTPGANPTLFSNGGKTFTSNLDTISGGGGSVVYAFTASTITATPPAITGIMGPSGGSLTITGTSTAKEVTLYESVNIAAPISAWNPVQTNGVSSGSFSFSVTQGAGSAFFRVGPPGHPVGP
jgi:hypothetical protein